MELLVALALFSACGAMAWANRGFVKNTALRRFLLLALALAPIVYLAVGMSTACVAENAEGLQDCDDNVGWAVALFFFSPIWLLALGIGAALKPRYTPQDDDQPTR
jgi:hypothetical protein